MKRSPLAPPRNYLNAIASLRDSLNRNRTDAQFATTDGHEIVYIFDANIFIFHADILDRTPLTKNFNYIVGNPGGNTISGALERLTARFLFSGHLPGQKSQRSFITLPHLEEVLRRCKKIAQKYDGGYDRWTAISLQEKAEAMRHSMAQILALDVSAEAKLNLLAEFVPMAFLANLNAAAHFTDAMDAAFLREDNGLAPLDRNEWGREASRVRADDVSAWKKVLPKPSPTRTPEVLQDDAETLATIVNLYRDSRPPEGEARKTLYVLVTADRSLASAVQKRQADLDVEGIPDFIRTPQDYLPLLNLTAMSEAMDTAELDDKTRKNFRRVFENLSSALDLAVAASADWNDELNIKTSVQLKRYWVEFSKYITVLSLRHQQEGVDRVFDELTRFLGSSAGTRSATASAERSVVEVRNRHLDIVIEGALGALSKTRPNDDKPNPRRANILIDPEVFGPLLSGAPSLNALLDKAVQKGSLPKDTMAMLRADPSTPEAQILAACLFVAAERWQSATEFAQRAYDLLYQAGPKRAGDLSEAAYLLALCLRFSLRRGQRYDYARQLLGANIQRRAGHNRRRSIDFLRGLRDEMELGSLQLTAAVTQEIAWNIPAAMGGEGAKITLFPRHDANTQLRAGIDRIRRARDTLRDNEFIYETGSQQDALARDLSWISLANLVGAFIFERIVPGLQSGTPTIGDDISRYVFELENEIVKDRIEGKRFSPTREIYLATAKALTEGNVMTRARHLQNLEGLLSHAALHGPTLPLGDRLEFNCISRWLSREQALIDPSLLRDIGLRGFDIQSAL
jgi:hypothetical protein